LGTKSLSIRSEEDCRGGGLPAKRGEKRKRRKKVLCQEKGEKKKVKALWGKEGGAVGGLKEGLKGPVSARYSESETNSNRVGGTKIGLTLRVRLEKRWGLWNFSSNAQRGRRRKFCP